MSLPRVARAAHQARAHRHVHAREQARRADAGDDVQVVVAVQRDARAARAQQRGRVAQDEAHHVAESTLSLVLNALGDSLLGPPIAEALDLPRDTARELAAQRLRHRLEVEHPKG